MVITNKEILNRISSEYKNDNIMFNTTDGVIAVPSSEVVKQTYQDIWLSLGLDPINIHCLASQADKELNGIYRDATKLRFINDLAAAYTIKALKQKIDSQENTVKDLESEIVKLQKEICWLQYNNEK